MIQGADLGLGEKTDEATNTMKKSVAVLSPALNNVTSMIVGAAETLLQQLASIVAAAGQYTGGDISWLADGYSGLANIDLPGSYLTAGTNTGSSGLHFYGLGRRANYPSSGGGVAFPTMEKVNVQMYIGQREVASAIVPITARTMAADLFSTR